jgi:hypothetical protein
MRRLMTLFVVSFGVLAMCWSAGAAELEKDVPWRAQAEIARRGAMVERVDGIQDAQNPSSAMALAMQPPADDSHKWLFTLVTMRNCQWCQQMRRDFESDAKLKAWVDTKDPSKSWAHWQIVQIEDKSQEWRWKDFRPTGFPSLLVQPPVNGSWGDPHTIVFSRQGYLKPAELDAAVRTAIQLYAVKAFPRRLAWEETQVALPTSFFSGGFQQPRPSEQPGGWNPPVAPPAPLPPVPNYPSYPNVPPVNPGTQPDFGSLLGQLLSGILGGTGMANLLLISILAWHVYRAFAKQQGIPLLLDDVAAARLVQILQSVRPANEHPATPTVVSSRPTTGV